MTATEPGVALNPTALSPDLRVNYSYGMVLGLDEFLQEQFHQQEQDRLHRRLLHGFGVSYGLDVTSQPDNEEDIEIVVGPGAAVDQLGAMFVLRQAQTTPLGAWFASEERAHPGIVAAHADNCDVVFVYVVASYDTCLDAVATASSQPDNADGQQQTPSRIRDSCKIELRWDPPPMPRFEAERRLHDLLARVEVVSEFLTDGERLLDAVRALADGGDPPIEQVYRIHVDQREAIYDAIRDIMANEVRPRLQPDLLAPSHSWDSSILLATIGAFPKPGSTVERPLPPDVFDVSSRGRPTLSHTQLFQRMGSPFGGLEQPTDLVTLVGGPADANPYTFTAVFHLDQPVSLQSEQFVRTARFLTTFTASAVNGNGQPTTSALVWTFTGQRGVRFTGERLSLLVDGQRTHVGSQTLDDWRRDRNLTFVNNGNAFVDVPSLPPHAALSTRSLSQAAMAAPGPAAVTEFVTVTDLGPSADRRRFELWFHPAGRGAQESITVRTPQVLLSDAATGDPLTVTDLAPNPSYANAWTLAAQAPEGRPFPTYLRFVFPAAGFVLAAGADSDTTGLADVMGSGAHTYVGWDEAEGSVVAFHRVARPSDDGPTPKARVRRATAKAAATVKAAPAKAAPGKAAAAKRQST